MLASQKQKGMPARHRLVSEPYEWMSEEKRRGLAEPLAKTRRSLSRPPKNLGAVYSPPPTTPNAIRISIPHTQPLALALPHAYTLAIPPSLDNTALRLALKIALALAFADT